MRALLKPGGILVCEDGDLTSAGSEPPSVFDAFAELWGRLGPRRGVDYTLGRRLFQMVQAAGFPAPEITFNQPVLARGEDKRFLELSVAEAGPAFVEAGLIPAGGAGEHPRGNAASERGRDRPCGDAAHGPGVGAEACSSSGGFRVTE